MSKGIRYNWTIINIFGQYLFIFMCWPPECRLPGPQNAGDTFPLQNCSHIKKCPKTFAYAILWLILIIKIPHCHNLSWTHKELGGVYKNSAWKSENLKIWICMSYTQNFGLSSQYMLRFLDLYVNWMLNAFFTAIVLLQEILLQFCKNLRSGGHLHSGGHAL